MMETRFVKGCMMDTYCLLNDTLFPSGAMVSGNRVAGIGFHVGQRLLRTR